MEIEKFDAQKLDAYAKEAKAQWGDTPAYREFEAKNLSEEQLRSAAAGLMELFKDFAARKNGAPEQAREQVKNLQAYISAQYYPCSDEILAGLGKLYGAGGEFTENIDAYAGAGTAAFAAKAIEATCKVRN